MRNPDTAPDKVCISRQRLQSNRGYIKSRIYDNLCRHPKYVSSINSFKKHLVPPFPPSGASLYLIPDQSALAARRRHLSVLQGKASVLLTTEENNDLSKVIDLPELAVGRHVPPPPPPSAECAERLVKVRLAGISHTWPLAKSSLQKHQPSFFFSEHVCILCENYPTFSLPFSTSKLDGVDYWFNGLVCVW